MGTQRKHSVLDAKIRDKVPIIKCFIYVWITWYPTKVTFLQSDGI